MPAKTKKLMLSNETLKNVREAMHDWYNVILTDEQIVVLGARNSSLKRELLDGVFDTTTREYMATVLVEDVLGKGRHWPLNGEGHEVGEKFFLEFYPAAWAKGYKIWEGD